MRVGLATATLLVLIAAHAVRETARDALFLADLPAERVPWAYLAIALGAVAVGVANRFVLARVSHRLLLVGTLGLAVLVDLAFWWQVATPTASALFGLYVWTGLLGTVVTLQLWLHLAEVFDVAEAKRAFPRIAAGGLAGAVLGSLFAGALVYAIDTRVLLLGSAGLLLVAAGVAGSLPARVEPAPEELPARGAPLHEVANSRYLRLITLLTLAIAGMATGADYLFKHAVATTVPSEDLGTFFAAFHACVNTGALAFELLLVSWVLRRYGVPRTLAVLPSLVASATGAFLLFGGFAAALLVKVADAALRPSIFHASTELLFQPLTVQARNAAKTAAESLGKRGGQAVASLAILTAAASEFGPRAVGFGICAMALLALFTIRSLKGEYITRFRERLSGLAEEGRTRLPRLDFYSLEALVANLSSPDESEALAALELLQRYGRESLISPLLLHHPSTRVTLRALQILQGQRHPHLDDVLVLLLERDDADVRAAALNALVARGSRSAPIEELLRSDPSPTVRSTAVVALAARHDDPREARAFLGELLEDSTPQERLAVARALPRLSHGVAAPISERIIGHHDPALAAALAESLAGAPRPDIDWIPTAIRLLAVRDARPAARALLLRCGDAGLRALAAALGDESLGGALRRHLPRTIHRFGTPEAAAILARHLETADGDIRYQILRGLGRMRADDPELPVPEDAIRDEVERSLERAIDMLALRVAYYTGRELGGAPSGPGEHLLGRVLDEKEARALERVFRGLHVLDPHAEFAAIFEALQRADSPVHSEGLELIEHVLEGELRDGLRAMVGAESDAQRLRAATAGYGSDWARELARALPEEGKPVSDDEREEIEPLLVGLLARLRRDGDPILSGIAKELAAPVTREAGRVARFAEAAS